MIVICIPHNTSFVTGNKDTWKIIRFWKKRGITLKLFGQASQSIDLEMILWNPLAGLTKMMPCTST